jgi:hypothetical protein
VLSAPQGGKAEFVSPVGDSSHDVGLAAATDAQNMQANLD